MLVSMLLRAYKYLYYRLYNWNLRTWGASDLPQYNALFGVSFMVLINILTLTVLIEAATRYRVVGLSNLTTLSVVIGLSVLFGTYFLLVHNNKYQEIARQFSRETVIERRRRLRIIVLYVLGSFVAFFGFCWIGFLRRR